MTTEKDLVLIYYEDTPAIFARIEEIIADSKPNWYHVKLLMLQVPPQLVTWILRASYINGEPFTMGGNQIRIERVEVPEAKPEPENDEPKEKNTPSKNAEVISLKDRLKNKS